MKKRENRAGKSSGDEVTFGSGGLGWEWFTLLVPILDNGVQYGLPMILGDH